MTGVVRSNLFLERPKAVMALVRQDSKQWHKGPVPRVNNDVLKSAIVDRCSVSMKKCGQAWPMGRYAFVTKVCTAVLGAEMVALWPLIDKLSNVQPELRFLPTQITELISSLMKEHTEWQLNQSTTIPNGQVSKIRSAQLIIVMAHVRRISSGSCCAQRLEEACSKLDKFEADMLRLYVSSYKEKIGDVDLELPPLKKKCALTTTFLAFVYMLGRHCDYFDLY